MTRRLLTIKGSFDDSMGGSVVAALNRSRTAALDGWEVVVATTNDGRDELGLLRDSGFEQRIFPRRFPRSLSSSPAMLRWLLKRTQEFDLVEVHEVFAFPSIYARFAARRHKVPFVVHPNNSLDPYDLRKHARLKRLLQPLYRWWIAGADALWLASNLEAERVETFGAQVEKFVSPLPVSFQSQFDHAPPRAGESDRPYVLFLGRLDPKKGIERLIRAVALAQRSGRRLDLILAGTGDAEYARALELLARSELAAESFRFVGHVSGSLRERLLAHAASFVLHSDNENFGIAVVEALWAGLPVILSPGVYIAEDLERMGVAVVVPMHDDRGLAEALTYCLDMTADQRSDISNKARTVAQQFDFRACADRDRGIRDRILSNAKDAS